MENAHLKTNIDSLKRRLDEQEAEKQATLARQRISITSSSLDLESFEYEVGEPEADGPLLSSSSSSGSSSFESPDTATPEKKRKKKQGEAVKLSPSSPGSQYSFQQTNDALKAARQMKWRVSSEEEPVPWNVFLQRQGVKEMTSQGWATAFDKAKNIYGHNPGLKLSDLVYVRTVPKSNSACLCKDVVIADSMETRRQPTVLSVGAHAVMHLRPSDENGNYRKREIGVASSTLAFRLP